MTDRNQPKGLANNLMWKFLERISAQLVSMVVAVILARILDPSHYGMVAMVTIFITIANVFVSDGFGSALVQKKDADELDFFSVLYFNIGFSILLYLLLFIIAPCVTAFYGEGYEILSLVLRVLGLRIILTAINSVQQAYIAKKMIFKKFFLATLTGTILSAIVGIWMAYHGYGVWALVAQYLTNTTVDTIFLYFSIGIKPRFMFSSKRLSRLLPFGIRILGVNLLINSFEQFKALLIGKVYSSEDLGYYDKGRQFPDIIINNISASLSAVLFPKMASEQNDRTKVKDTMKLSIRCSSFLLCPMLIGLAAIASSFVELLLTSKWLPCVPMLRALCIAYMFMPIHSANMQAIKAMGEGRTYLIVEVIKKAIEFTALIISIRFSVYAVTIAAVIYNTLFVFINAFPNGKLINYGIKEQLKDIAPGVMMSLTMGTIVYIIGLIEMPNGILLLIQIFSGMVVYLFLAIITRNPELVFVVGILKRIVKMI